MIASPPLLMLSQDTVRLIIIGGFVLFGAIRFVLREAKRAKELQQARQRRIEQEQGYRSVDTKDVSSRPQSATPKVSDQPNNLTLAQMRERIQAKIAYDKRVTELRRRQAQEQIQAEANAAEAPPRSSPTPANRPGSERNPAEILRRKKILQQRARAQQAGRSNAALAAPRPVPAASASGPSVTRPDASYAQAKSLSLGSGVTEVQINTHDTADTGDSSVHRHVADIAASASVASRPPATVRLSRGMATLNNKTLRDAFVLREIFDPPVGMRS